MNVVKSAQADVKERIQNVAAKVEEKRALSKASTTAKAERKEADNKAGKHEAKANYHTKQADILREYEQKVASNAAEKEQTKTSLHQKKADKHTNKADKHATGTDAVIGDAKTGDNVDQTTTASAPSGVQDPASNEGLAGTHTRDAASPGVPSQADRNTSTPAVSDVGGQVPEGREEDTNVTNPVQNSEVPLHGSGVPTHSTLHSSSGPANDTHDIRTTQTTEGSPNNGSYL